MISADLHIHMFASSYIHKLQLDKNMYCIAQNFDGGKV